MLDENQANHVVAAILAEELERVALVFERQLASDLSAVNGLCLHVEKYRGKMLRPTLVLLSGMAAAGGDVSTSAVTESHRIVAAVVEMIHMATLVHDDVLDEAEMRRRGATVNHLWGNETAVMLGDYLISNAFHLCSTMGDPSVNVALGEVTNTLCEGELIQLHHRDDFGLDEETYLEIIRRKTASLIAACCRLGGQLAGAEPAALDGLATFGSAVGTAFQIRDDMLDLIGETDVVGKSLGRDLDKGKLTLPLIHLLSRMDAGGRGEVLQLLESREFDTLRDRMIDCGVVESSQVAAERLAEEAITALDVLPPGPARDVLVTCAEQSVSRTA